MTDWTLRRVTDLPILADGWERLAVQVSQDGALLLVSARSCDLRHLGAMPNVPDGEAADLRLDIVTPTGAQELTIPKVPLRYPMPEILPDGRIVLVGSRARYASRGPADRNVILYDPVTGDRTSFPVGDAVAHVQVDRLGRIWISYFDEAWPNPGLVCLSPDGERLWDFPQDNAPHDIFDCYALNVAGKSAYLYYYTDFPLCRVGPDFSTTFWGCDLEGCAQVALHGQHALFSAQYNEPVNRSHLMQMTDAQLTRRATVTLRLPDDAAFPTRHGVQMRGSGVHVITDTTWYSGEMSDLITRH